MNHRKVFKTRKKKKEEAEKRKVVDTFESERAREEKKYGAMKDNLDNRRIADRDGGKISKQREIEFGIASVYRAISLSRYRHSLIFLSLLFFFLFLRFHYSVLHTSRFSIRRQMSVCLEIDLHIYIYIYTRYIMYIYIYIYIRFSLLSVTFFSI